MLSATNIHLAGLAVAFAVLLQSVPSSANCNGVVCPTLLERVCGSDRTTYNNECELVACSPAGTTVACEGWCPCCADACDPTYMAPVCGSDGQTYNNDCLSGCANVEVECQGECPCPPPMSSCEELNCSDVTDSPVCSEDGVTYDNDCEATCDNAVVECLGQCPCSPARLQVCPSEYTKVISGGDCGCYRAFGGIGDEYPTACNEGETRLSGRKANEVRAVAEAIKDIRLVWTAARYRQQYGEKYTWANGDDVEGSFKFRPNKFCMIRKPGSGELRRKNCNKKKAHIVCKTPCSNPPPS